MIKIERNLAVEIVNYLNKKPYGEVAPILQLLISRIQSSDKASQESKTSDKSKTINKNNKK